MRVRHSKKFKSAQHHRRHHPTRPHKPPVGSSPGTLVAVEQQKARIRLMAYDGDNLIEEDIVDVRKLDNWLGRYNVTWIDIQGLSDLEALQHIAGLVNLHPLVLEDIVHVHQRPKLESYPEYLFAVTRMPDESLETLTEQVSLLLGKNFLITFQERSGDCFDPVRVRLRAGGGRLRVSGPDYLAYALIDAVTDAYFPLLESYGRKIDALEELSTVEAEQLPMTELHDLKRDFFELRRAIWPQRDMIGALLRDESGLIGPGVATYLRDCQDHTFQLLDIVESYRDTVSSLRDLYLSSINMHMNQTMRILTMIATIFIPLSFIAGIYGMNFDPEASPLNMPELNWYFGYPFALVLMLLVACSLLLYFFRKGWIRFRSYAGKNG